MTKLSEISSRDKGFVLASTFYEFLSTNLQEAEVVLVPETFEDLRQILIEVEANFGAAPTQEMFDSPGFEHEADVPETCELMRNIILTDFKNVSDKDIEDYAERKETLRIATSMVPEDEYTMLDRLCLIYNVRMAAMGELLDRLTEDFGPVRQELDKLIGEENEQGPT